MNKRIGVIGIVIDDRRNSAPQVNEILSNHSKLILARMGLPCKEQSVSVISLIVEASTDDVGAITGKLGMLQGVRVKSLMV